MNNTDIPSYVYNYYGYDPNEALAYFGTAFFGLLAIAVTGLNIKFKSWFFSVIPIASVMNVVGFVLRPHAKTDLVPYIISVLCILLSPTVFAMADYTLISRIMRKTGITHPVFRPNLVRWIFLAADVLAFIIQATGGGLTAIKDIETSKNGARLLLAGLCISLTVFVFFLFVTAYVHTQLHKLPEDKQGKWKVIFWLLYIDMILLITRSAYRVAEFANLEYHNSISTNETLFYTLDALEMALLNLLWVPFHPGFWDMLDIGDEDQEDI